MRTCVAGIALILGLLSAAAARTETPDHVARLLNLLRTEGYREITYERTLLNRLRIVAELGDDRREIVVDPRTGEILRDYRTPAAGDMTRGAEDGIVRGGESGDAESRHTERSGHETEEPDTEEQP